MTFPKLPSIARHAPGAPSARSAPDGQSLARRLASCLPVPHRKRRTADAGSASRNAELPGAAKREIELEGHRWTVDFEHKQWTHLVRHTDDGEVADWRIVNLTSDGGRRFYEVLPGAFGQPLLRPEPDRALDVPANVRYVDRSTGEPVQPGEKIAGLIVKDEARRSAEVRYRASLTKAAENNDTVELRDDGSLGLNGVDYHLHGLISKDRNRTLNYDALFCKARPNEVFVAELEQAV